MTYTTLAEHIHSNGDDLNDYKKLEPVFVFEEYFKDVMYPIWEDEGYDQLGTGVIVNPDNNVVSKLIVQLNNPAGYDVDIVFHFNGKREYMKNE